MNKESDLNLTLPLSHQITYNVWYTCRSMERVPLGTAECLTMSASLLLTTIVLRIFVKESKDIFCIVWHSVGPYCRYCKIVLICRYCRYQSSIGPSLFAAFHQNSIVPLLNKRLSFSIIAQIRSVIPWIISLTKRLRMVASKIWPKA